MALARSSNVSTELRRLAATARHFAADQSATTAVEYAVMTLIAIGIVGRHRARRLGHRDV